MQRRGIHKVQQNTQQIELFNSIEQVKSEPVEIVQPIVAKLFKPTIEQQAIFDYVKNEKGHLAVMARAGVGKTASIVEMINYISWSANITILCFNKHIQEELKRRIGDKQNVKVYTTHSMGYSAIKRKYKDAEMDEYKLNKIINKLSKKWKFDGIGEDVHQYFQKLIDITNLAKQTLSLDKTKISFMCRKYEITVDRNGIDIDRVLKILEASTLDTKTFDFTDMIFMPATDPKIWMFPQDYVIVDEAQDLNYAQQLMINKILKRDKLKNVIGRVFILGDSFQSIQGFAGSSVDSMNWFINKFNMKILPLTYTFRCGKNIIKHANEIVPDIKAKFDAIDGVVRDGNVLDEATDGDFVLARKTKPLVVLFFQYLVKKRKAMIKGADIGEKLIDKIKDYKTIPEALTDLGKKLIDIQSLLIQKGIFNYEENQGYSNYKDSVDCIEFLSKTVKTIDELKAMINSIFSDKQKDGIILSTIHKSKGLEANRVFIIQPNETLPYKEDGEWKYPLKQSQQWMKEQEMNLLYVAITRAKSELIYDRKWTDKTVKN